MTQFPDAQRLKEGSYVWRMALKGFSGTDVGRGIAHCTVTPMNYFPTCAQFREFCYNAKKTEQATADDGFFRSDPAEQERTRENMKCQRANARKLRDFAAELAKKHSVTP